MSDLTVLFGPPASGKSAIGHELAALTGHRFFHNHATTDPVAALFGWDHPRFWTLVRQMREQLFREVANDTLVPGVIFTFVWAFNVPEDRAFVERVAGWFEAAGGRVRFVELLARLPARLAREGTPFRVALKPFHRDVEAARRRQLDDERNYVMNTSGDFPLGHAHLRVDTERMSPPEAAAFIAAWLQSQPASSRAA